MGIWLRCSFRQSSGLGPAWKTGKSPSKGPWCKAIVSGKAGGLTSLPRERMKLHLVRHGDALDHAEDEKRELSSRGLDEARALGRFFKQSGVHFDTAYTSPLIRARQTSETILATVGDGGAPAPQFAGAMLNSTGVEDFHEWLAQLPGEDVLLVGHEPSLSERIRSLLGMITPGSFSMKKGACAGIRTRDGRSGQLLYHITPTQLGI